MEKVSVLFVCLGNICRSPTAHGVFQHKVAAAGLDHAIRVDSAGTGAWHLGNEPDSRAAAAAQSRGYDLSGLRARQADAGDFDQFDYILAMDRQNLRELKSLRPAAYDGRLDLLLNFGSHPDFAEVPDPYYGGVKGFELVLDLVENAADGLLADIRRNFSLEP
ncbi:low molecular weight phosphotyrosine protein phosphatase [Exilibacterium tricleocarpae]|uniref:protein-tyrosine-phosphatase n=1 Tax=Exilibacterium tricleocarpae TaxID=2591008 RepID=A0A545TVY4_9GAMM|nr:low molecular weight protein-tyrosine-phosphatase [Exilibacterium tricleocarpae]TQV81321.1 low molecular weight phosphotyrosine protein phosphatase [Exilibacterium tricleocarpae]